MKCVYVSGPYRASTIYGMRRNVEYASGVALKLWKMGYSVWCPHANTAFMDGEISSDQFIEGDVELLRRFTPGYDMIVMLPRWRQSEGAKIELAEARRLGLIVRYWNPASNQVQVEPLPKNAADLPTPTGFPSGEIPGWR